MKKTIFLSALFVILLAGCKDKKTTYTAESPEISVAKPEVRDISLTKDYPGSISANETVEIVARVSGTLQAVDFKPGEVVQKGQLLFVIEPTLYQNSVKESEASLKTAQAKLEYAQSDYERMQEAIKSDAVSRIQLEEAKSNVAEAVASVSTAEAQLNTARTNLNYCYIKAPFTGHIDRTTYDVGSYINGSASPVTLSTMYKDDTMYAYFNIADNQWLSMIVNSGDKKNNQMPKEVDIRLGKDNNQTYKGVLDYLSPNVDLSTGTIDLRAKLDNKDGILKNGLYVTITLPYGEQKQAILIPDASIGTDQVGKYVYMVNDSNMVKTQHIKVGQLIDGDLRQVTEGLSANDLYVTKALLKVKDGMIIKPMIDK